MDEVLRRSFSVRDSLNHHSSGTLEFNSAGLGLGLTLARGIVEAHGGVIEAESTPDRGSTFAIRVPYHGVETLQKAA
jgi:signal transduction histidine kinase